MIPRLKRREQFELNQNTELNLNLTLQISFSGWKENWICFGFQPALLHPEPALHCPTSPTSLELLPVYGISKSELRASGSTHRAGDAQSWRRSTSGLQVLHSVRNADPQCRKTNLEGFSRPQRVCKDLQPDPGLPMCSSMKREHPGATGWRGPQPMHIPAPCPRAAIPSEQSFFPQLDHQPRVLGSTNQNDNGDRTSETQVPAKSKPSRSCGMLGFGSGPSVLISSALSANCHKPPCSDI